MLIRPSDTGWLQIEKSAVATSNFWEGLWTKPVFHAKNINANKFLQHTPKIRDSNHTNLMHKIYQRSAFLGKKWFPPRKKYFFRQFGIMLRSHDWKTIVKGIFGILLRSCYPLVLLHTNKIINWHYTLSWNLLWIWQALTLTKGISGKNKGFISNIYRLLVDLGNYRKLDTTKQNIPGSSWNPPPTAS